MERNDERRADAVGPSGEVSGGESDPIEERLIEGREESQQSIEAAADEAFVEDQRENPDHPTRIQREQRSGIDDPSHSQGI